MEVTLNFNKKFIDFLLCGFVLCSIQCQGMSVLGRVCEGTQWLLTAVGTSLTSCCSCFSESCRTSNRVSLERRATNLKALEGLLQKFSSSKTGCTLSMYQSTRDKNDVIELFNAARGLFDSAIDDVYLGADSYLIVLRTDVLVGFVIFHMVDEEEGSVDTLLVNEKYRRKGYGRLLMNGAIQALYQLGAREITLTVGSHNHQAQHLYTSLGFRVYDELFYSLSMALVKNAKAEFKQA